MDNENKEGCNCGCCKGYCRKCRGMIWGLIGILILINAFVWPQWSGVDGWMVFFGWILILGGVWKSLMPGCACHKKCDCGYKDNNCNASEELPKTELPQAAKEVSKEKKKKK